MAIDLNKFFDDKLAAAEGEVALLTDAKGSLVDFAAASKAEGKAEGIKEAEAAYQKPDPSDPAAQYTQEQLATAVEAKEKAVREEMSAQLDQVKASEAAVKADYDAYKVKAEADQAAAVTAREEEIFSAYESSQVDDAAFAAAIKKKKPEAPKDETPAEGSN